MRGIGRATNGFTIKIGMSPRGLAKPRLTFAYDNRCQHRYRLWYRNIMWTGLTKTILKQHALEKNMLSIAPLVPNADLLIQWSKSGFDSIYRSYAVGRESDTRSSMQSVS